MKRRDLLKTGLSLASLAALSGCSAKSSITLKDTDEIIPKQTGTYIFSCPMPFDFKVIDELVEINKRYKKSQIKTLFNNTPMPLSKKFNAWMQVNRGYNFNVNSYDDYAKYVRYAISKGFDICYLLNAPKPFTKEDYDTFKNEFKWLLGFIKDTGIKDIKIGNTQTASLINEIDPSFTLSASTALEYHSLAQYKNLIEIYPNIKLIDVAIDENHNFHFLENLKKLLPDIDIEVMVDESCMKGCPARISHISELSFCRFDCYKIKTENPIFYAFKYGRVYPWNLEYYSAINVNNFKFSAAGERFDFTKLKPMKQYLDGVEYGVEGYGAKEFLKEFLLTNTNIREEVKVSYLIPYLPDVRHFVKNGQYCATRCGDECNYCRDMAEKMNKFLDSINARVMV